jgi:hypothetical protein
VSNSLATLTYSDKLPDFKAADQSSYPSVSASTALLYRTISLAASFAASSLLAKFSEKISEF